MQNVIYLKKVYKYEDVIKNKFLYYFKYLIFFFKYKFNIPTIKENNFKVCILPIKEKAKKKKMNNIIKKMTKIKKIANSKFVISNDLLNENILELLIKYNLPYFDGQKIKKILLFKELEYIHKLQCSKPNMCDISILCNKNSILHQFIIKNLALQYKSIKIVTQKMFQFKKIENELYNDEGIAIQFSNSYTKSLVNSKLIVNLDFNEIQINDFLINNNAIIVNSNKNIKIKSRLFNGIVVNSCRIDFNNNIKDIFRKENILNQYDMLYLYESIINWKTDNYEKMINKIEEDKINILNLIGNSGVINTKEFKFIMQKA